MEKQCRGCAQLLPLDQFYLHPRMADGRLNFCRSCVKGRVKKRRESNIEHVRAYDKWRYQASQERKRRLAEWSASRSPEQRKANNAVSNAVRDGRLARPNTCSNCGKSCKPEAHHDDYSRPLNVRWLCRSCHVRYHKEVSGSMPSQANQQPPVPVLQSLADGAIRITVGGVTGTVHSDHLVSQKLAQLVAAWRRGHGDRA